MAKKNKNTYLVKYSMNNKYGKLEIYQEEIKAESDKEAQSIFEKVCAGCNTKVIGVRKK